MFVNKMAFAGLALACIGAAGAGSYLALRQSAARTGSPAPAAETLIPAPSPAPEQPMPAPQPAVDASTVAAPAPVEQPALSRAVGSPRTPASTGAAERPATQPPADQSASERIPDSLSSVQPMPLPIAPPSPLPGPTQASDSTAASADGQALEPAREPERPVKSYDELIVPADSVIGLQIETTVTSERARVEDRIDARVSRDVRVGDRVAIPAGTKAYASVTQVDRGGKFKERGRLAIRFYALVLPDNTRMPVSTETIIREGPAPGNASAAKVGGGAAVGTILGAIIGGRKGALIGGAAGAGAGGAAVAASDRSVATLTAGTPISVRLLAPVTVTVEQPVER
jgi:hypothetical protein